jgi:hypothetical protein
VFTIMVFTTTTAAICGHATLGKPKRFRQTVDFMLTDENDGKLLCRNVSFLLLSVENSETQ